MEPGHDPGIGIAVAAKGRRVNGGKNRDPDDQAIGPVESYDILSQGHYFWIGLCTVVRFTSPKNYTIKLRSSSLISLWFAFTHNNTFHLKLWQELPVLKNRWNITWTSRGNIFDSWYCNLDFNDFSLLFFPFIIGLWELRNLDSFGRFLQITLLQKDLFIFRLCLRNWVSKFITINVSHHAPTLLKRGVNWMP